MSQKKRTKSKREETPARNQSNLILEKKDSASGQLPTSNSIFDYLRKKEFPYKEKTFEEYRKNLEKMNLGEMQLHAVEIAQIIPNTMDRARLVKRLEDEFLIRLGKYTIAYTQQALPQSNVTPEQEENIKRLLKR